ncbi:MAG: serine hydrolase [Ferruginibacter sp.]
MAQGRKKLLNIVLCVGFLINVAATPPRGPVFPLTDTTQNLFPADNEDVFFVELFKNYPGKFDSVLLHRVGWNVQIIYTQIDRDKNGTPSFKEYAFNKKDARYFYPDAAIDLAIAMLALQKLHELPFPAIDMNSSMITEAGYAGQIAQYNDPNTPDGRPTIAQYIKEMLTGNDPNAFNRLYEFLGQEYINKQLLAKGYKSTQILHRDGVLLSEDENRHTNPIAFYNRNIKQPVYQQPMQNNLVQYDKRNDFVGKSYYKDNVLVNAPMDFSQRNRMSLDDLNRILLSLMFPEKVKAAERFGINETDRKFLLKYISQLQAESTYPSYDSSNKKAFAKYILKGAAKDSLSKNIRIFNKSGMGHGQVTEVAYVADLENKIEFMVAATIYCNKDEILDDNKYDYDTIGLPFMKDLGKALYDLELKRKRNNIPDLSSLVFTYDK